MGDVLSSASRTRRLAGLSFFAVATVIFCVPSVGAQSDPCAGTSFPIQCQDSLARGKLATDLAKGFPHIGQMEGASVMGSWQADQFAPHPWLERGGSEKQWLRDELALRKFIFSKNFWKCLEPRLVSMFCPYCQPVVGGFVDSDCYIPFFNPGKVIEYWWPEAIIEVNNFGIQAINAPLHGKPQYHHEMLLAAYQAATKQQVANYVRKLSPVPEDTPLGHQGQTHATGLLPGDQTTTLEGHVYQTGLQWQLSETARTRGEPSIWDFIYQKICISGVCVCVPGNNFLYNGYWKGNTDGCFYDTLDAPTDVIKVWTEDSLGPNYAKHWRIPPESRYLAPELWDAGVPLDVSQTSKADIFEALKFGDYAMQGGCDSYRVAEYPGYYSDLQNPPLNIQPVFSLAHRRNCYTGGGQLYPLVGSTNNIQHDKHNGAIVARRAAELAGLLTHNHLEADENHCTKGEHLNRFTKLEDPEPMRKEVDKLQVLTNRGMSQCFRMSEVADKNQTLFPQLEYVSSATDKGSIRYIYWNKRKVCMCELRGWVSSLEQWNGLDLWSDTGLQVSSCLMAGVVGGAGNCGWGWGCMPYPDTPMDEGRGNLEFDEIEGKGTGLKGLMAKITLGCFYPFAGWGLCDIHADGMIDLEMDAFVKEELCEDEG